MKADIEAIYRLLPAIDRLRDTERGGALKALLGLIAEQHTALEEDLAQRYDDHFIETCAEWLVPYIGDLVGHRGLHGIPAKTASARTEVANTIGYRRRKGTVVMLEQLARDVTGWKARVVEFFQRLATTQYLNHLRPENIVTADLRKWEPLERLDSAFDGLARTADMRRIEPGRGRYNIPNVGVFLWTLNSYPLTRVQPRPLDARRFFFSPLGNDTPLFTLPETQEELSGLASRMNVPDPISRRTLHEYLGDYYGADKSIQLATDTERDGVKPEDIVVCDLSDVGGGAWAHEPATKIAIDPALGRIAFPAAKSPAGLRATFHYGFSADLGGGEYERGASVPEVFVEKAGANIWQVGVSSELPPVAGEIVATLAEAVFAWNQQASGTIGVIAILDSASYAADLSGTDQIRVPAGSQLLVVAADWPKLRNAAGGEARVPGSFSASGCRPHLRGKIEVLGTATGDAEGGRIFFNGVLLEGALEIAEGRIAGVSLRHCTLVPGHLLMPGNFPQNAREPSIVMRAPDAELEISSTISGGLRVEESMTTQIADSIVDATSPCGVAFAGHDGDSPGGPLRIERSTVVGKVRTALMELASNSIFFARLAAFDAWPAPVWCERRQSGCVRFCFVPLNARTPRRHRCQPENEEQAARVTPQFESLRFGDPRYAQLSRRGAREIAEGADDGSEMGAFHEVFVPQRIANLRIRLGEYLRVGLEAGIFFSPQNETRAVRAQGYGYGYGYVPVTDLCGDAADPLPGIGAALL